MHQVSGMRRNSTRKGTVSSDMASKQPLEWRLFELCRRIGILPACCIVLCCILLLAGCGALNLGKLRGRYGIERTSPIEKYWLVKEIHLSSGSSSLSRSVFDHNLNPEIALWFTLANETNKYVAESRWLDPAGEELRTIQTTYDIQQEGKKSVDPRNRQQGTPRVHAISTQELYVHKPGLWKVSLYIDGELARTLEFSVK